MKDILLKLYELNERYHDTKEKMAWLASSLYAAFSIALLKWMINKEYNELITNRFFIILLFFTTIFICAMWFVNFQYKKKRDSVKIDGKIKQRICELNIEGGDRLVEIFNFMSSLNRKRIKKKKKDRYWSTEIPINLVLVSFYISQVAILLIMKNGSS